MIFPFICFPVTPAIFTCLRSSFKVIRSIACTILLVSCSGGGSSNGVVSPIDDGNEPQSAKEYSFLQTGYETGASISGKLVGSDLDGDGFISSFTSGEVVKFQLDWSGVSTQWHDLPPFSHDLSNVERVILNVSELEMDELRTFSIFTPTPPTVPNSAYAGGDRLVGGYGNGIIATGLWSSYVSEDYREGILFGQCIGTNLDLGLCPRTSTRDHPIKIIPDCSTAQEFDEECCNDVLNDSVKTNISDSIPRPGSPIFRNVVMKAGFKPKRVNNLQEAAEACGYDRFNWLNAVLYTPFMPPFIDPPKGVNADYLWFYYDEGPILDKEFHITDHLLPGGDPQSSHTLGFTDTPINSGFDPLNESHFSNFLTSLVGIKNDGSFDHLYSWTWKSNFFLEDPSDTSSQTAGGIFDVELDVDGDKLLSESGIKL